MEDCAIIRLFFERDETALAEISRKYGAGCRAVARNILNNHEDAEQCVNDAYLRAWESIPPNNPPVLGGKSDALSFDELEGFLCRANALLSPKPNAASWSRQSTRFCGKYPQSRGRFSSRDIGAASNYPSLRGASQ